MSGLRKKIAPYLLASTLSLPIASCSRDITSPKYEEPVQTVEQFSQKYEPLIQSGNYNLEQMLSEVQEIAGAPYDNVKQKAVSLAQLASETASETLNCDLNKDNKTNIFDLLELLKILGNPESYPKLAGDVNNNEKTDIFDLITLLQVLGGNYGKYQVYGKALGIHAGNPEYSIVPNAVVSFKDKDWNLVKADTADAQGNYSVYLVPGDYEMCVSANDYHNYPYFEEKNQYVKWYYFDTKVNSNLNKNGVILNKDIDIEFFYQVLKKGYNEVNVPLAKWETTPKDWVQENTRKPEANPALNNTISTDFINFQSEIIPEIVNDSLQANVKHYFVPDGHPRIGHSSWASYEVYVDWSTNTITGARIWYYDGLSNDDGSKGVYREEVSQSHMNLSDTFNPAYSAATLYHDSGIAKDFTQLDKDDIGTIYPLIPKGY